MLQLAETCERLIWKMTAKFDDALSHGRADLRKILKFASGSCV